jgi:hypothetical protein
MIDLREALIGEIEFWETLIETESCSQSEKVIMRMERARDLAMKKLGENRNELVMTNGCDQRIHEV